MIFNTKQKEDMIYDKTVFLPIADQLICIAPLPVRAISEVSDFYLPHHMIYDFITFPHH